MTTVHIPKDPQAWIDQASKLVPPGYTLERFGVAKAGKLITRTPVAVEAVFLDIESGREFIRLAWLAKWVNGQSRIRRHVIPKDDVSLGVLANHGLDVGHDNTRQLKTYLRASESMEHVPRLAVASQMGWTPDKETFLWGEFSVTEGGYAACDPMGSEMDPAATHLAPTIPSAYFDGLEPKGTMAAWMEAASIAGYYPRVALAINASVAPVLMRMLRASNFAIQWAGPGSTGKSTCIALAASVWGNPDVTSPRGAVFPSSASDAYLRDGASAMRDLPVCLDGHESQMALTRKIQTILSGRTETQNWTTVVLAAGADTLADDEGDDAVRARLIGLWGPPFGRHNPDTGRDVSAIKATLAENYGHFGPEFVRRLMKVRENGHGQGGTWIKWAMGHLDCVESFTQRASVHGGLAGHTAQHLALLTTTAKIVHALFPELEWDHTPTIKDLWDWLKLSVVRSSRADAAINQIKEYRTRFQDRIGGIRSKKLPPPRDGWVGCIDGEGRVWIVQGLVNDVLVEAGLRPMEIYREWLQTGVVVPTAGRWWRTQKVGTQFARCIALDDRFDFQSAKKGGLG